ncbi:TetR/AcrR family transcriptional regulator, partial [Burkholderia pseudomallei]
EHAVRFLLRTAETPAPAPAGTAQRRRGVKAS